MGEIVIKKKPQKIKQSNQHQKNPNKQKPGVLWDTSLICNKQQHGSEFVEI